MTAESVCTRSGLEGLASAWQGLESHDGLPTLSHAWQVAGAGSFSSCRRLGLLAVWDRGQLAAVAPLVVVRRGAVSRLQILGMAELHEPSGFVYRDEAALERLCEALVDLRSPAILERVASDRPLPAALGRAAGRRGRLFVLPGGGAPFLDLSSGWDAVWGRLSARRRHDHRRARRQLEKQGGVTVDVTRPGADEIDALLSEAFGIEASGWKARRGSAMATRPEMSGFFTRYARHAAGKGDFVVSFLRVGERAIAMQLAVLYAGKYWLLKIGYDEEWARQSPGVQLVTETVRWACENGLSSYEFLGSEEQWLNAWRPGVHPLCTLLYYPYGLRGGAAFAADGLGFAARRLGRRMRRRVSAELGGPRRPAGSGA